MRVITLDVNKKIISVKTVLDGYILQANDIETGLGEMGQIQQLDGSFINDTTLIIPPVKEPTNKELQDNQLILMDVLATMYEDMLAKGTV
jgi:hypothetical protein